jgi:anti-anti-sigma regulatory factor
MAGTTHGEHHMNTTALIEKPDTAQHAAVAWAPARLDVHHLPELLTRIDEHRTDGSAGLVLDCSAVAFIDEATVEAIRGHEQDRRVRIARPSTAMRITFELLGHTIAEAAVAA